MLHFTGRGTARLHHGNGGGNGSAGSRPACLQRRRGGHAHGQLDRVGSVVGVFDFGASRGLVFVKIQLDRLDILIEKDGSRRSHRGGCALAYGAVNSVEE